MSAGSTIRQAKAAFAALALLVLGCARVDSDESLPAALEPRLDPTVEAKARDAAKAFVESAPQGKVASLLSASSRLKDKGKDAAFIEPFSGASALEFDSVSGASGGKKVVARVHFTGKDGKTYRTNLTLVQEGEAMRVEDATAPTFASAPVSSGGQTSKM